MGTLPAACLCRSGLGTKVVTIDQCRVAVQQTGTEPSRRVGGDLGVKIDDDSTRLVS